MNADFNFDDEMSALEENYGLDSNYHKKSNVVSFKPKPKPSAQEQAKAKRAKSKPKGKDLEATKAEFETQEPGLVAFLRENQWSDFFGSLLRFYNKNGWLSDKQVRAARSAQAKIQQNKENRAKEIEASKVEVDLTSIHDMFETARQSKLKYTKYRAEGLVLSPASPNSRNAGAIYVVRIGDEQYLGKVLESTFHPIVRACTDDDKAALLRIAEDPKESAIRWGRKTGRCSCCGRELTNAASIEAGIGPICATKWGF